MKTTFINLLPQATQESIKDELINLGLSQEDIERGMSSRLCDLEDTININKYLYTNQLSHIKEIILDIVAMESGKVELDDLMFHAQAYNEEYEYNLSENSITQLVNEVYSNIN